MSPAPSEQERPVGAVSPLALSLGLWLEGRTGSPLSATAVTRSGEVF